jgi:hypothetical protein
MMIWNLLRRWLGVVPVGRPDPPGIARLQARGRRRRAALLGVGSQTDVSH